MVVLGQGPPLPPPSPVPAIQCVGKYNPPTTQKMHQDSNTNCFNDFVPNNTRANSEQDSNRNIPAHFRRVHSKQFWLDKINVARKFPDPQHSPRPKLLCDLVLYPLRVQKTFRRRTISARINFRAGHNRPGLKKDKNPDTLYIVMPQSCVGCSPPRTSHLLGSVDLECLLAIWSVFLLFQHHTSEMDECSFLLHRSSL